MTAAPALGPAVAPATASPGRAAARPAAGARADASAPDAADTKRPASRLDRAGARQGDDAERAETAPPFADLLATPTPVPTPAPAPEGDRPASTGQPDPAAPGQLLALLDGYRLDAIVPAPGTGAGATGAPFQPAELAAALASGTAASASGAAAAGQAAGVAGATSSALPLAAALEASAPVPATGFPLAAATALPEAEAAMLETLTAPAPGATGAAPEASALAAPLPPIAARVPQAAPALPPLPLPAQPADGFDDGFGGRIAWIAGQRLGHAEIRLNPEHLGVIDVRLQLDGDQVRAEFNSANSEVRQAIEASLPRLRELLGQHGLQLGQADVGQRQPGGDDAAARTAGGQPDTGQTGGTSGTGADTDATTPTSLRTRGLVDEYA